MEIEKQKPIEEIFTIELTGRELLVITRALGQSNDSRNDGNYTVYAQFARVCVRYGIGRDEPKEGETV